MINDILVEAPAPLVHGDDNAASIRVRPGGSAANTAAWLARLGLDVVFAGRVSTADAAFHRHELASFGVTPHLTPDDSAATGAIVVLVGADGERTMITDRGANLRLRPADAPAALLDGADLLHLTGYTFFAPGPRTVALTLIDEAKRRAVPFTVDPSSAAFLAALASGAFLTWTAGAAVCFPNRDEAAALTAGSPQSPPPHTDSPDAPHFPGKTGSPSETCRLEKMATALTRHYDAVAVKLGPAGAMLATRDTPPIQFPALPATVRDTTGAGDAFCAGFLAALLTGAPLPAATLEGTRTAAQAVTTLGGRPHPAAHS